MSGLARILARQGVTVTGSDMRESPTLDSLRRDHGIRAVAGHAPTNIGDASTVVYSAAIKEDNPELAAARASGVDVVSRAAMLGRLMDRYPRSVGIAGTHGKTTTTGMVGAVLEAAGLDPTVLVGGDIAAYAGNARLGATDVFAAEACEAYGSFLELRPEIAVVTNLEADHLDYYKELDDILDAFRRFLGQTRGLIVACADDTNVVRLLSGLNSPAAVLTYGAAAAADLSADRIDLAGLHPSFDIVLRGETLGRASLGVPGRHNVLNALAAVGVGLHLGASFDQIAAGLASFTGAGRRFERLGETADGVLVIDDYAHHPAEIRATLSAVRSAFPNRRVTAVFQPHLPSRTRDFLDDFAASFADADRVVLTDIYLAREQPLPGLTGATLAERTAERRGREHVVYIENKADIPQGLRSVVQPEDIVITMGAGDIRVAGEAYLAEAGKAAAGVGGGNG